MNEETKAKLKEVHTGNFWTLFKIYQSDRRFYKSWFFAASILIAILMTLVGVKQKTDFFDVMDNHLFSIVFTIIPCLLGFNLGAFILIVGFGSSDILKKITKPLSKQKNFSYYQKMISVLGISVLIQIFTLILNFLFQLSGFFRFSDSCNLFDIINPLAFFSLVFFMLYSLSQLFIVVKHVFMFGQTIHFNIQLDAINSTELKQKNDNSL